MKTSQENGIRIIKNAAAGLYEVQVFIFGVWKDVSDCCERHEAETVVKWLLRWKS